MKYNFFNHTLFYHFVSYSLFCYLFVLPIPHTNSLRYLFFSLLLLSSAFLYYKNKIFLFGIFRTKDFKRIKYLYFLLTVWLILGAAFISENPHYSFSEIKGQWINPLLSFFIGFVLLVSVHNINNQAFNKKDLLYIILLALLIHIVYLNLFEFRYFIDNKTIVTRISGLAEGPDRANMLTNTLLSLLMVEVIYRFRIKNKILPINNFLLTIFLVMTILSSAFEGMRNGVVALLFLTTSSIFFIFYKKNINKKIKLLISILLLFFLSLPFAYNIQHDKRWNSLIETIPIALDIDNNLYWLDKLKYKVPKLKNGEPVNDSNYSRIAWFKAGLLMSIKDPMGIGYQRNSFEVALKNNYGPNHANSHAHSSLIEWLLAMGYIGVILCIMILFYIIFLCIKYFIKYESYFSIFLFFTMVGTASRAVVDTNMRDHMFLTFMFIVGLSLAGMYFDKKKFNINPCQ
ncbi:O-antigen ligase family protein [Arcobacter sp. KX21116]|uniref:O-antigen ligase family protein n=1 Tax=Arcobacter iocasae TaxID=2906515 RepID=UPI0035D50F14